MTKPMSPERKRIRADARKAFDHFNRPGSITRIFADRHGGRISTDEFHEQLEKSPEAKSVLDTLRRAGEAMQANPEVQAAFRRMAAEDERILNPHKSKRHKK